MIRRTLLSGTCLLTIGLTGLTAGCNTGSHDRGSAAAGSTASNPSAPAAGTPAPPSSSTPTPSTPPAVQGTTITTFATGLTPSTELFVATTGDDTRGDGSAANPYATIGRAAQAARPGTAIRVRPGTYAGGISVSGLSGTPAAPIWIGGVPGSARPVLQGGGTGIQLSRVRYLVLENLEVTGSTLNGINCDDGGQTGDPEATRHVVLQNLYIHDVGSGGNNDGLKLSGLDDYYVLDCTIARINAGSGIDHVGCHNGLIARCRLEDTGSNAVQLKGGTRNVEVRWCTLVNPGQRGFNIGGSTGDPYFRPPLSTSAANVEATDIRIVGNVIVGGVTAFAFVGATNSVAAHNTVVNPQRWLFRILQEKTTANGYTFTETQRCQVLNTIFYFSRATLSTAVNIGPNTQPGTYTMGNNLYFAHDDPGRSQPTLPVTESGTVTGDPLFTNASGGDYSLRATSPAAAAGAPQTLLSNDVAGNAFRPAPSIGAYALP